MKRIIFLATLLAAISSASHAEPTSRRLWLLCQMEDPTCVPLFQKARRAYEAAPLWRYGSQSYICAPDRNLSDSELLMWFMRIVPMESPIWEAPARIGIWEAMHHANACQSRPVKSRP